MRTRVHVSLPVRDLDASIDFYRRFLGREPTKRNDGDANFRLDTPALHLALMESPSTSPAPGTHYGVEVFEDADLAAWRERVESAGVETRVEDDVTCCYARADKFWVHDPEGREWEVWLRRAEADTFNVINEPTECCPTTGCCPDDDSAA